MKQKCLFFSGLALMQSVSAYAATAGSGNEAPVSAAALGAHVHGELVMQLAQDGEQFQLMLDSPAINILGFESRPVSQEQKDKVSAAMTLLKSAEKVFHLEAAKGRCEVLESQVSTSLMDSDKEDHDHDDHGDHQDHDEEHASITAEYRLRCDAPDSVKGLRVTLFESFPGVERVEVQWVLERGQGASDLTAASPAAVF